MVADKTAGWAGGADVAANNEPAESRARQRVFRAFMARPEEDRSERAVVENMETVCPFAPRRPRVASRQNGRICRKRNEPSANLGRSLPTLCCSPLPFRWMLAGSYVGPLFSTGRKRGRDTLKPPSARHF